MASDSESIKDRTLLDLTETPCGICGPSTCEEEMIGCDGCSEWFHSRCVGVIEGKFPKRWYCQSEACQEKVEEYQKRKKQSRSRKQTNESDKSSIHSRVGASSVEAKVRALEERQKRQMEELEVEMQLRKKEREIQRALEKKKMEMELQLRAEEEEEVKAWQAEMLQRKKEQIERMKAKQESFERQMAGMDKELAGLSALKAPKPASKITADVAEPSSKPKRNALKLEKENANKFVEDDEYTEEEDGDNENSKGSDLWSQSSYSSIENKAKRTSRRVSKQFDRVSQNGLGQQQIGPTKAQMAARSGLTYKLPKFSGEPAQWPLFYAAYKASNESCGYMNHENLMQLQEALEGDALELLSGQLLLPETIPRVMEKLRRHYGRPEQLLESLLDKVNRLDPPQPDNLRSFIPFGNTVEQLCGHLEAANLRQHLVNPLLVKSLVAKLPDREKREWVHYQRSHGETNLRTLTDFLMGIVDDACEANVDVDFNLPSQSSRSKTGNKKPYGTGALYCHCTINSSTSKSGEKKWTKPCKFCKHTDHHLRHCMDFAKLQYNERLRLVAREKLCHSCLNGHGGQCKFKVRCSIGDCRGFHNSLMHPVENAIGCSTHIQTNCPVMFRIVPVQLHCGDKSATVLAFLDEGSSVTLVEQELADRLGAVGVQERLTIKWTGNVSRVENTRRTSMLVSSNVDTGNKQLLHTVNTVKKLMLPCQKLNYQELIEQYEHLRGLSIESYNGHPQLLIGANNIHSFVPTDVRVGASMEPIAVRTNLGWTVYGPIQTTMVTSSHYLGCHQLTETRTSLMVAASMSAVEECVQETQTTERDIWFDNLCHRKPNKPRVLDNSVHHVQTREQGFGEMIQCTTVGKLQKRGDFSDAEVTVNPGMPDVTGWGVATSLEHA